MFEDATGRTRRRGVDQRRPVEGRRPRSERARPAIERQAVPARALRLAASGAQPPVSVPGERRRVGDFGAVQQHAVERPAEWKRIGAVELERAVLPALRDIQIAPSSQRRRDRKGGRAVPARPAAGRARPHRRAWRQKSRPCRSPRIFLTEDVGDAAFFQHERIGEIAAAVVGKPAPTAVVEPVEAGEQRLPERVAERRRASGRRGRRGGAIAARSVRRASPRQSGRRPASAPLRLRAAERPRQGRVR